MFTGIVQAVGTVGALRPRGGDLEVEIGAGELDLAKVAVGDSISVSGVCLTVTRLAAGGGREGGGREGDGSRGNPRGTPDRFFADVSRETLACTTLGSLAEGRAVNLEPALRAGDALGGHLVSGHVDGVGELVERRADARSERFTFAAPEGLARYIAAKGSICIDGVSLTVNEVVGARFGVNLIPHTLQVTTLGALQPGAQVNLEVDLIARYVERLTAAAR